MMKQDRFLTGILIGIVVIIIAALIMFSTRKDNLNYVDDSTPEGVIQNYVVALHKHDFNKAYSYLAEMVNKPSLEYFSQSFLNHNVDPTNSGLEIGKTEISGNTASVSLGVIMSANGPFSSGYQNTEYAQLILQNGDWKIKQLPYNFWSYDWYQPTPIPSGPVK